MTSNLDSFTDVLGDAEEIENSQPLSLSSHEPESETIDHAAQRVDRPRKHAGQRGDFRSIEEIDSKYRGVFSYPYFNIVQSSVIEDALYSDKSMVVCAPTGSGKTVVFEMAIVQLLMHLDDINYHDDFKIIYMAPVKALCTERLTEWYPKLTRLGLLCIEVTGDTDVDFTQLKPYRVIVTTPEKWDMLTRRWRDHRNLVEVVKLFLIDEVHILNDQTRGPVLEAVVSRMKTIEASAQSVYRIEQLQKQMHENDLPVLNSPPHIRFVAVSATVSNPEDVAAWLGTKDKPAVFYKFGDECRPVKLKRVVEGYPCPEGMSIFKFDIILNYKLWPVIQKFGDECRPVKLKRVVEGYPCPEGMSIFKFDIILNYKLWPVIQKYHDGKPTLIFCNTRKSVLMTAETLSKELTISFTPEQKMKLTALASTLKNKKLQTLILSGVGCHHAGLLYEERTNIENAFRNRDLPILITTTTLAMGVNLPAHLVIVKNTQQYVNGAYQEYSISTVLQMVGRAGRPQFDESATAVIMTRLVDKPRYQALVGGSEPLQSYLHKRLAENLNSEAALRTVCDVAQCVQWLRSTFLCVRAVKDPRRYLALQPDAPTHLIYKKLEELCVKAMNGLASAGLITMDEASCIDSTEAGRLMSVYYLDLETMKHIMKIDGTETLERLLWLVCESHELADMHLRVDERRSLNALNRNSAAATIRFPMKGKITNRQMKLNCIIQAVLGCLMIPDPSLNQEAMKVMRIADRICKCLVAYVTRPELVSKDSPYFSAVLNTLVLAKCIASHLWENSVYVSKQLKGIGPAFSTLLVAAGKTNFMLLEESHPRDLERIMNKSAPAGNVLRKQISLLPKYQLTISPKSSDKVSVQLSLLNYAHLSENIDQLTAGDSHKCYVIVGDSKNYILLLTSFKDKDLISMYDGCVTYEVTRKHNFEHKIIAHCVSSNFVGIDVQSEYVFKDLQPIYSRGESFPMEHTAPKKIIQKQTTITESFKERKRKSNDLNVTQSKEKRKRDNAVIEKFKHLKESFGKTSKELKEELQKSTEISNKLLEEIMPTHQFNKEHTNINQNYIFHSHPKQDKSDDNGTEVKEHEYLGAEDSDGGDSFMADEQFDSILHEIENEISKTSEVSKTPVYGMPNDIYSKVKSHSVLQKYNSTSNYLNAGKAAKHIPAKRCNYKFLELMERNVNLSDDDETPTKDGGFTDTIKNQVQNYLTKASMITVPNSSSIAELISSQSYAKAPKPSIQENSYNTPDEVVPCKTDEVTTDQSDQLIHPPKEMIANGGQYRNCEDIANEFPAGMLSNNVEQMINTYSSNLDKEILYEDELQEVENCKRNQDDELEPLGEEIRCVPKYFIKEIVSKDCEADMSFNSSTMPSKALTYNKNITDPADLNLENNIYNVNTSELTDFQKYKYETYEDQNLGTEYGIKKGDYSTDTDTPAHTDKNESIETGQLETKCNTTYEDHRTDSYVATDTITNKNYLEIKCDSTYKDNRTNSFSSRNTNDKKEFTVDISRSMILSDRAILPKNNRSVTKVFQGKASDIILASNQTRITEANISRPIMYFNQYEKENNNAPADKGVFPRNNYSQSNLDTIITDPQQYEIQLNKSFTNNKEHVNKYAFSATKIDVCTKKHKDYKVQIIRKLKLDLDVTEILSRGNNDNESNFSSAQPFGTMDSKNDKTTDFLKVCQSNKNDRKNIQPALRHDINFDIKSVPCDERFTDDPSIKILEEPERKEQDIQPEQPKNIEKLSNEPKGNIESILQKYSKILRKNENLTNNVTNNESKAIILNRQITQRPYKIKEINNLDITLPSSLTSTQSDETGLNKDVIIERIKALNRNLKNFSHTASINKNERVEPELDEPELDELKHEDIDDECEEMTPIAPLPVSRSEPVDFNIDQSMFNPKTLLKCFSNELCDVLLPPDEFRDFESAPTQSASLVSQYTGIDDDTTNILQSDTDDNEFNKSVFGEDKSFSVLTPSKEIETWTLSRHADYDNSPESFTIMRKNPSAISVATYNIPQLVQRNRKSKLGQFTCDVKKKLKM